MKRKLATKEEPEPKKLPRPPKSSKPNEGVFAALCSTLSQAVLPGKKTTSIVADVPRKDSNKNPTESNHEESGFVSSSNQGSSAGVDNNANKEEVSPRRFKDSLHGSPDNSQHGDDNPLIPKASPEMAVNGS